MKRPGGQVLSRTRAVLVGAMLLVLVLPAGPVSAAAPNAPTGVTATLSAPQTITVSWIAPVGGDPVVDYAVTLNNGGGTQETPGLSVVFSNLTLGTTYTASVIARNPESSMPASSDPVLVALAPGVPVVSVGVVTASSVAVSWSVPLANGSPIIEYRVSISLPSGQSTTTGAGDRNHTFSGLSPSTLYTVTVVAVNGVGPGGGGTAQTTTSAPPANVPGVPVVSVGAVSASSVSVSWSVPAANGSPISGYQVSISPSGQSTTKPAEAARNHTFNGLSPATLYTVTVVAVNEVGPGGGGRAQATTSATAPGAPGNVSAATTTPYARSVVVSWTAPSDLGGAPITGYVVVLGGQTQRPGPTVTSVQFDGLPAGALQATVRATNNAGTGAAATSPSVEVRLFPPFNSEAAFVTQQYRDFLDRAPDAGGLAHWQGVTGADGGNVDEVILSFMRSGEFAPRRAVTRFYLAYFDRGPDRGGLDFWAAEVFSGRRDLVAVSNYFASSPELLARYGQLSNESFVALVYNNVLRREPDLSGYNYWLTQLNNGMPRGHVMIQFSESAEFVAATAVPVDVTLTYSGMLNRIPDPVGYEFWVGLVSGQPNALNTLIEGFFASAEYASLITP